MNTQTDNPVFSLKIVKIGDVAANTDFLSRKEKEKYLSFKIPKRKTEWLAGRLAAKQAFSALLNLPLNKMEITYDSDGKPCFIRGKSIRALSISHSNEFAAAAIPLKQTDLIGLDIEKIENRHPYWNRDYFHDDEIKPETPAHLTRLWTIKEALLKALGLGLKADPLDIRAKFEGDGVFASNPFETTLNIDYNGMKRGKAVMLKSAYGKEKAELSLFNKVRQKYIEMNRPEFQIITKRIYSDYMLAIAIGEH